MRSWKMPSRAAFDIDILVMAAPGKGTAAASDVDPSQAGFGHQPIEKDLACDPAPGSHHPLARPS